MGNVRVALVGVCLWAPAAWAHHPEEPFAAPGTEPFELVLDFESPQRCFGCHRDVDPPERVAPGDTWAGSMHANAFRDPIFQAALSIANQDHLDSGSFCLRCHTPVGWLNGRSLPGNGSGLEPAHREGITCAFCHRLDPGRDRLVPGPLIGQGSYYVHDELLYRGPFADAPSLHPTVRDPYIESAELCGICHSVSNPGQPYLDPDTGEELMERLPEQHTYEEWAQSAFAAEGITCQRCHMSAVVGRAAAERAPLRPAIGRHDFAGANVFGAQLLRVVGPPERAEDYAWAEARARESLRGAARISVEGWPLTVEPDAPLPLVVRVENLAGHKLPTGYPEGRRVWLEVEASVDEGPYFTSGRYDHETATLPDDPWLRTYETLQARSDGGAPFHLLLNDTIRFDTRIPPRGFEPDLSTRPVRTDRYQAPDGSWRHWDEAPYVVPGPPPGAGVVTLRVRLLYQSVSREMVEWLRAENHSDDRGERLHELWEQTGRAAPVEMAALVLRARRPGTPVGPDTCNGVDDDLDGAADEGFGVEDCGVGECRRTAPVCVGGALVGCVPGEPSREWCNGLDEDCDAEIDEALRPVVCGVGECAREVPACVEGEPVDCVAGEPVAEVCNGADDDCDNVNDEGFGRVTCGVGACRREVARCTAGELRDCAAGDPTPEVCNGVDDDCDGEVDEQIAPIECAVGGCEWTVSGCIDGVPSSCEGGSPEHPERCNARDDDCDGAIDEELGVANCGVGDCARERPKCEGGVLVECVPGEPADEICGGGDEDCDHAVDEDIDPVGCGLGRCVAVVAGCVEGEVPECVPGTPAEETCDGTDEDCDGETDEALGSRSCGIGACAREVPVCAAGERRLCLPGPAEREDCNLVDDDCDGEVDEALAPLRCGVGACAREMPGCVDGAWIECVPGEPQVELCGGGDEDCDGTIDEGFEPERCGVGACARVVSTCEGGPRPECVPGEPELEVCGGGDEDCDGALDEGLGELSCGVGACARTVPACADGIVGHCLPGPRGVEICGGEDEDCDGALDEDTGELSCGVGACVRTVAACAEGAPGHCTPGEPGPETCDGVDEDCDGAADERLGDVRCGIGACARVVPACEAGEAVACVAGAPADEICGGGDEDCDGETDEGCEPDAAPPPPDASPPDAASVDMAPAPEPGSSEEGCAAAPGTAPLHFVWGLLAVCARRRRR